MLILHKLHRYIVNHGIELNKDKCLNNYSSKLKHCYINKLMCGWKISRINSFVTFIICLEGYKITLFLIIKNGTYQLHSLDVIYYGKRKNNYEFD